MIVELKKSTNPKKKYMVILHKPNNKTKTVHFGQAGASDFTKHKDKDRKDAYISRHAKREDWTESGIETAGFWAKNLLWNMPTLRASIKETETKFGIKVKNLR